MAEGTTHDMEEEDFESLLLETDVRGYLYEPQYSEEQLRLMEEQEAEAAAEAEDPPVASEKPGAGSSWCGLVAPVNSLCAYGHRARVRPLQRISKMPISPGRNV